MNADQKQRANELLSAWRATAYALHGDRMVDLLQELVDASEQAAGVPDRWKLVPVEPGRVMQQEGWQYAVDVDVDNVDESDIAGIYRAMLAAAPESPANEIKMPTTADEAAGMVMVGTAWLQQNAPHRLRQAPAVQDDLIKDAEIEARES